MQLQTLKLLYNSYRESALFGRYIQTNHIEDLIKKLNTKCTINVIGKSVLNQNIYSITVGSGKKKVLMWSQMHGNESTTTKALFDLINLLSSNNAISDSILEAITIKVIPILNPDGAKAYTRLNANNIDLNRDAKKLTQPESIVLRKCFNGFKPNFCYNLHGQRTIFGVKGSNLPATVSFLAPAQDEHCTITSNRKKAMELIVAMNTVLQTQIPNQIGIYDDAYNINCVGDTFQRLNVPTILFEAGHYHNDYNREHAREFIFQSLVVSLNYIMKYDITGNSYTKYLDIPENEKSFFDTIIRNAKIKGQSMSMDIAIQFQERLKNDTIEFIPKVVLFSPLATYLAHREINANNKGVFTAEKEPIFEGYENDFVFINNEKLSLKLTKT